MVTICMSIGIIHSLIMVHQLLSTEGVGEGGRAGGMQILLRTGHRVRKGKVRMPFRTCLAYLAVFCNQRGKKCAN